MSVILTLLFDSNIIRRCQRNIKRLQYNQRKKVRWGTNLVLKLHIMRVKMSDTSKLAN